MPGDAIIMKICGRISKFALPVFLTISGSYDVWRLFQDFHIPMYIGVLEAKMLDRYTDIYAIVSNCHFKTVKIP